MRSNPAEYEMVAPQNLEAAVSLLADKTKSWFPVAGGTDVMVQYSSGKLAARQLMSIWNLPELRRIDVRAQEIRIGAGCTYADLRRNEMIAREFPLLAKAAGWIGGIANQNRGTIGGNIVNASPAADALPSLLAYEADLIIVSARGERRVPYVDFHVGYKKMQLGADELVRSICLLRKYEGYLDYTRKVGTRNAQAISKVCIAALARLEEGSIADVRIALGSVGPVPLRLRNTEKLLSGKRLDANLTESARNALIADIAPIDDIRSTARYRSAVAGNLVVEFLDGLRSGESRS
jgi:CO/xanthine dehydrogenase FAD-binding subunit